MNTYKEEKEEEEDEEDVFQRVCAFIYAHACLQSLLTSYVLKKARSIDGKTLSGSKVTRVREKNHFQFFLSSKCLFSLHVESLRWKSISEGRKGNREQQTFAINMS